jgi:hypothetical protein
MDWHPQHTCIFEAKERVGGRAYSKAGIPGLADLRIDLGAYRFDTHNHVLVNRIVNGILKLPTRCYDPRISDPTCNAFGNLSNVRDAYGNNAGYATGPEGLALKFREAGGHIYFGHRLVKVDKADPQRQDDVLLEFSNKVSVVVKSVFLNIPAPAMNHLDNMSIVFTGATQDTREALAATVPMPGAKQFLVYPKAPWRSVEALREGLFSNATSTPPLVGRLHEFYGKCKALPSDSCYGHGSGCKSLQGDDCFGAVLTYYDFPSDPEKKILNYFAKFQENLSDPYTYLAYDPDAAPGTPAHDAKVMIESTHESFVDALLKKNAAGFNNRTIVEQVMPMPSGTVLAMWWSRDAESSIYPEPSTLGADTSVTPNMRDPQHRLRNRIMKPVDSLPIYIANEAYSGGAGWAQPALTMTERVLWHHFGNKAAWVGGEDCEEDCLLGLPPNCKDCVSSTWWAQEIGSYPPTTPPLPPIPNCQSSADELVHVVQSNPSDPATTKCAKVTSADLDPIPNRNGSCSTSYADDEMALQWSWTNTTHLFVSLTMENAQGWTGVGFGAGMTSADMVVLLNLPLVTHRYNSTGYQVPTQVGWGDDLQLQEVHVNPATSQMSVSFVVSGDLLNDRVVAASPSSPPSPPSCSSCIANAPSASLCPGSLSSTTATKTATASQATTGTSVDMIFSRYSKPLGPGSNSTHFPQHTWMRHLQLDLACGRDVTPTFEQHIKPLFRAKDRAAMLFSLDLHNYTDVFNEADSIYNVVRDKTFYNLATGMPKDKPWSLRNIHLFQSWIIGGKKQGPTSGGLLPGVTCTSKPKPTFYGDIKGLFREKDVSDMLFMMDLSKYKDVSKHAIKIFTAVSIPMGQPHHMPCDSEWSAESLSTFEQWVACGKEEGDPASEGAFDDAEVFYKTININSFPEYRSTAKRALQYYIDMAWKQGPENITDPSQEYRRFWPYNHTYFETVINNWYSGMAAAGEAYDPADDAEFTSRAMVVNWLTQYAPYHLTDGAWIAGCCPTGPIDEIHAMLWGIYNDELGMGERKKNHCFVYQQTLESIGVSLPEIHSRDFAYDPRLLKSAFTQAAFSLTIAQFSDEYFEELLGATVQLEMSSIGLVTRIKRQEYWGIDAQRDILHVGIDNAAHGHGYRAVRATMLYLDQIRETSGEAGVQAAWRRIWNGFMCFDALSTFGEDVREMNARMVNVNPTHEVVKMMEAKAKYGSQNHLDKRLGVTKINALFANPKEFVEMLGRSAWVVPGNPDVSALMDYLTTFEGPMFRVFNDDEFEVWRVWIREMKSDRAQNGTLDIVDAMEHVIVRVMRTAMSVKAHQRINVWGPSPNDPALEIEQPVSQWLQAVNNVGPKVMMRVLANPRNNLITPGAPLSSRLVTGVLKPGTTMGKQFARIAVDAPQLKDESHRNRFWTWTDIVQRWIADDCPMEPAAGQTWKLFVEDEEFDFRGVMDPVGRIERTLETWREARPYSTGKHYDF